MTRSFQFTFPEFTLALPVQEQDLCYMNTALELRSCEWSLGYLVEKKSPYLPTHWRNGGSGAENEHIFKGGLTIATHVYVGTYPHIQNDIKILFYDCITIGKRRAWRYQRGNQNSLIEEEQTTQWPKENKQKDKQRSTKHTHKTVFS
jgi:hypothetical protein